MLHRMRTVASGRGFLLLSCGLGAPLSRPAPALLARASPALRGAVPPVLSRARTIACSAAGEPPAPRELTISTNPSLDASLPFRTLAFYVIAPVSAPDDAVADHTRFLTERDLVGRVYVCADGLNAQVSGRTEACAAYRAYVASLFPSESILFKEDPTAEPSFPRLRVKHKALVPSLRGADDAPADLSDRGIELSPAEWDAMLADTSTPKRILDVRNGYEWDVGRFDGADRPQMGNFAESDEAAFGLDAADPAERAETPVMMYCTGGIRCEYLSARLRGKGYRKVFKLQGGVQHYGNARAGGSAAAGGDEVSVEGGADGVSEGSAEIDSDSGAHGARSTGGAGHWRGSLFVFDRRNVMSMGSDEVLGKCHHCGAPTELFVNCANVDCNLLHLVCENCVVPNNGCCCEKCQAAPRRRPLPAGVAEAEGPGAIAAAMVAATQGPPPGEKDPNRLSSSKPHGVARSEYDADVHGHASVSNN